MTLNYFAAHLYRNIRRKGLWAIILATALFSALCALSLYITGSDSAMGPTASFGLFSSDASMGEYHAPGSFSSSCGEALFSGNLLPLASSALAVILAHGERKSRFAKNVFADGSNRIAYFLSLALFTCFIVGVLLLASLAIHELALALLGYRYPEPEAPETMIIWTASAWLCLSAYSVLTLALTLIIRSEALSCCLGILFAIGAIGSVSATILEHLPLSPAGLSLSQSLPYQMMDTLSGGAGGIQAMPAAFGTPLPLISCLILLFLSFAAITLYWGTRDIK